MKVSYFGDGYSNRIIPDYTRNFERPDQVVYSHLPDKEGRPIAVRLERTGVVRIIKVPDEDIFTGTGNLDNTLAFTPPIEDMEASDMVSTLMPGEVEVVPVYIDRSHEGDLVVSA